jgi:hypothetical protein
MHTSFQLEKLKRTDYLEDPGIDGMVILECILKRWRGRLWNGFFWLRIGACGGNLVETVKNHGVL